RCLLQAVRLRHAAFSLSPCWIGSAVVLAILGLNRAATALENGSSTRENDVRRTDLFISRAEGYRAFRIPAMIVTPRGTVLAICEGRKKSTSDSGNIDLVLRRSTDGGKTWEPLRVIIDDGDNTAGNPCPVVDRQTGTIWLPFCRNNREVLVTFSRDEGETW